MRGEKQHTEGARGEAPGEPRDTEGSAPLCSASYADPPGVAAVVGVFPVVSRPDEHVGAPCRAHALCSARRRRQATTITHTITHHTPCCRPLLLLPSPDPIAIPSPLPPSEMPSTPPLAHTLAVPCARAHAGITLRCVAGERDSTDRIQHTSHTSHTRIQRAKNERRTHIICGRRTVESGIYHKYVL